MNMARIDTHCHLTLDEKNFFPDLKTVVRDFDNFAEKGNMVESRICDLGCKKMYGIDSGIFLRQKSSKEIFNEAKNLRKNGVNITLDKTFEADNITAQLCFSDFLPENCSLTKLSPKIKLLAYIDNAIAGNFFVFCPDHADLEFNYYESICDHFGKLHNLLIDKRYKNLTFILLHGGNPYVGETTYLARMFPNVIIDFTWISWMTRTRFRMALAEWIEVIPYSKFCWGSDSNFPENIVGIGQIVRKEISNVLEDLIERKIIDKETAVQFLEYTYQKTPKRIFNL